MINDINNSNNKNRMRVSVNGTAKQNRQAVHETEDKKLLTVFLNTH